MTTAFCAVARAKYLEGLSYVKLLDHMHKSMRKAGFTQTPMLTSTQAFDLHRVFLLDGIVANSNPVLGRVFRRKFPPQPRKHGGSLEDMIGVGAAVVGGAVMADL